MTIEQVVCVCLGAVFQTGWFLLGIAVGMSFSRKEAKNVSNNKDSKEYWHNIERR